LQNASFATGSVVYYGIIAGELIRIRKTTNANKPERRGKSWKIKILKGVILDTQDKIEYWLELAEYDFQTAKVMQYGGRYLYVGFMCQQVIEKALKAVITKTGFPPKIHDLLRLAKSANLIEFMNEGQIQFLHKLTPLNIKARYPSCKEDIARGLNKDICGEYLIQTEDMLKWIKEKLQQ
jgi:HEPN domain-containing protein